MMQSEFVRYWYNHTKVGRNDHPVFRIQKDDAIKDRIGFSQGRLRSPWFSSPNYGDARATFQQHTPSKAQHHDTYLSWTVLVLDLLVDMEVDLWMFCWYVLYCLLLLMLLVLSIWFMSEQESRRHRRSPRFELLQKAINLMYIHIPIKVCRHT